MKPLVLRPMGSNWNAASIKHNQTVILTITPDIWERRDSLDTWEVGEDGVVENAFSKVTKQIYNRRVSQMPGHLTPRILQIMFLPKHKLVLLFWEESTDVFYVVVFKCKTWGLIIYKNTEGLGGWQIQRKEEAGRSKELWSPEHIRNPSSGASLCWSNIFPCKHGPEFNVQSHISASCNPNAEEAVMGGSLELAGQ